MSSPERPGQRTTLPLHRQVYLALLAGLEAGHWRPGDQLPTEHDLARIHGCSVITVRRALAELVTEHRIERIAGRGTFAIEPPQERSLTALTSYTDDMRARGLDPRTTVVTFDLRRPTPPAARHLSLDPDTQDVYFLERIRLAGDRPVMLEQVELPAARFPGLSSFDGERSSLYDRLARGYGVELTHGYEFLEPGLPSRREAQLLDQPRTRPVLLLELISYTPAQEPIEYCRSVIRGDAARFQVEVSRRSDPTTPPAVPPRAR